VGDGHNNPRSLGYPTAVRVGTIALSLSATTEATLYTLSIEHAITDFSTWKTAFDSFSDARAQAGVQSDRIRRPIDDGGHLVVELDFQDKEHAEAFRQFLTTVVWTNPEASPALASTPTTRILEPAPAPNE
jgi:hypothetical protein